MYTGPVSRIFILSASSVVTFCTLTTRLGFLQLPCGEIPPHSSFHPNSSQISWSFPALPHVSTTCMSAWKAQVHSTLVPSTEPGQGFVNDGHSTPGMNSYWKEWLWSDFTPDFTTRAQITCTACPWSQPSWCWDWDWNIPRQGNRQRPQPSTALLQDTSSRSRTAGLFVGSSLW